jgi:hypothetical protein
LFGVQALHVSCLDDHDKITEREFGRKLQGVESSQKGKGREKRKVWAHAIFHCREEWSGPVISACSCLDHVQGVQVMLDKRKLLNCLVGAWSSNQQEKFASDWNKEKKNEEEFALGSFHADRKSIAAIWIAWRFGVDRIWFAFT